jgi:hypothetical protein
MMEYIKLMLPMVWVAVSTGVGLILYRTSGAWFNSLHASEKSKKNLKLTGSIVIAGVTFFAIYYVTPSDALVAKPAGMEYVSVVELQRLEDRVHKVQDDQLALSACLSANLPKDCSSQMQDVQISVIALEQQAKRTMPALPERINSKSEL